ncbi:MAG: ABC transporter ATP-binding protein [Chloroflexi bacterium]|nr:ABC transporter ATP-binding protein [Chloroflexota bacterium]
MIRVRNLTVSYGPVAALHDVDLDVQAGECLLVTGPSGCGKSTLARALTGLIPQIIPAQCSGEVMIAGLDPRQAPIADVTRHVGIVFQNPSSQLFHLHVADEVAFGPRNLGLDENEVQERVAWALGAVGISDLAGCNPAQLSGGQKQRVAIASALAMRPEVLVLDEPTASLDVDGTGLVIASLQELRRRLGMTIVLVEHRLAAAARLADRVVVMDAGRVIARGDLDTVFQDRSLLRRLGLRRPLEDKQTPWHDLIVEHSEPLSGQQPLLELRQVSAGYDRKAPVLHDITLNIFPGEFIALVGENGAGKSTLALTASGLLKPSSGSVRFAGGKRPRPGLDVSMLFQNPAAQLFTDSVDEEVSFGPRNFKRFDPAEHEQLLNDTDLMHLRDRHPTAVSVGQQQRIALAACLALRPRLLVLDEPTLGQDWGHLERMMEYLLEYNRRGSAILLITHDYKLIHRYVQRVLLIQDGRIALDGRLNGAAC